jgi:putative phosphoribosyl transferase
MADIAAQHGGTGNMSDPDRRRYRDRSAAGRALGAQVAWVSPREPVVLGMVRGGVPVAFEVAAALRAPLDVLVVRKVGAPGNPELAIGAVAEGGVRLLNESAIAALALSAAEVERRVRRAQAELVERLAFFRRGLPALALAGRAAVVVDDGFATGASARAAVRAVRARGATRVLLAAPVGAAATVRGLRAHADAVICPLAPEELWSVGAWYERFDPVPDEQVRELLACARAQRPGAHAEPGRGPAGG